MKRTVKAAVLLMCISLCAFGLFLLPKTDPAQEVSPGTELLPVKNPRSHRGIWLRV
jgi:hypothetical protein